MDLRPYQKRMFLGAREAFRKGATGVCLQAATGSGKTAISAEMIRFALARGGRVIFGAHLFAILDDTIRRLGAEGLRVGAIQAGEPADPSAPVQVASLQTLWAMLDRGETLPPCSLFVLDEGHRSRARTVDAVLRASGARHLLVLTATPSRGDGQGLGRAAGGLCDALVCGPQPRELVAAGYLVPVRVVTPYARRQGQLEMDPVDAYTRHTPGERAVVFARDQAHARDVAARFGDRARLVLGGESLDSRRDALADVRDGRAEVLVTVRALAEGMDLPAVSSIISCHSLEGSIVGYLQQIGRGCRTSPGKVRCTFADLTGAVYVWGPPHLDRSWSLDGRACTNAGKMPSLRHCQACDAVFEPANVCPVCGEECRPVARMVKVVKDGQLLDIDALGAHHLAMEHLRSIASKKGKAQTESDRIADAIAEAPPWVRGALESWES